MARVLLDHNPAVNQASRNGHNVVAKVLLDHRAAVNQAKVRVVGVVGVQWVW